jgi:signal transduction histidine kinase
MDPNNVVCEKAMVETEGESVAASLIDHDLLLEHEPIATPAPQRSRAGRLPMMQILAVFVHDLRSPLSTIQNTLQYLKLVRDGDVVLANAVGVMDRQVRHLGRLIGDLLDITRLTTGKLVLHEEWLELATTIGHAVEACHTLIEQHQHHLTVFLPPSPVHFRADPTRMQEILVNLLTNAAKYTDPGGHIWLIAEVKAEALFVRVRDDGTGIAPDLLPRIFDLFQQGPANRKQEGMGIGLALVQWLAELHGGSITAHSDGPGRGSEFVVRLPSPAERTI